MDANRRSWAILAREHYETYKARLSQHTSILNPAQIQELGDVQGKTLIHRSLWSGMRTLYPTSSSNIPTFSSIGSIRFCSDGVR